MPEKTTPVMKISYKGISTLEGHVLVCRTEIFGKILKPSYFYMKYKGARFVSSGEIARLNTDGSTLPLSSEWTMAKKEWVDQKGNHVRIRNLTEIEKTAADRLFFKLQIETHYGFSLQQLTVRKRNLTSQIAAMEKEMKALNAIIEKKESREKNEIRIAM